MDNKIVEQVYDILSMGVPPQRRHGYPRWANLVPQYREEYIEKTALLAEVFKPAAPTVIREGFRCRSATGPWVERWGRAPDSYELRESEVIEPIYVIGGAAPAVVVDEAMMQRARHAQVDDSGLNVADWLVCADFSDHDLDNLLRAALAAALSQGKANG